MTLDARRLRRGFTRRWNDVVAAPRSEATRQLWADVRARHPRFTTAVVADARITAANRGDRFEFRSRLDATVQIVRLAVVTDSFLALCCYRAKAALQSRGVPVVPRLFHRLAITTGQVSIGDPVVVAPGVYIPHGQVVVDGITTIGAGTVLSPFVTIGLRSGQLIGPAIGERVYVGAGAEVVGPVTIGRGAQIGAGAVVLTDVPAGRRAIGVAARVR